MEKQDIILTLWEQIIAGMVMLPSDPRMSRLDVYFFYYYYFSEIFIFGDLEINADLKVLISELIYYFNDLLHN